MKAEKRKKQATQQENFIPNENKCRKQANKHHTQRTGTRHCSQVCSILSTTLLLPVFVFSLALTGTMTEVE